MRVTLTGISLSPSAATNQINSSHTVTVSVYTVPGLSPIPGVNVTFTVTAGPNAGATGLGVTDAAGHATFTYHDAGGAGTDTIVATFHDSTGAIHTSNTADKIWGSPVGVPEFGAPATLMTAVALLVVSLLSRKMRPTGIATRS